MRPQFNYIGKAHIMHYIPLIDFLSLVCKEELYKNHTIVMTKDYIQAMVEKFQRKNRAYKVRYNDEYLEDLVKELRFNDGAVETSAYLENDVLYINRKTSGFTKMQNRMYFASVVYQKLYNKIFD